MKLRSAFKEFRKKNEVSEKFRKILKKVKNQSFLKLNDESNFRPMKIHSSSYLGLFEI